MAQRAHQFTGIGLAVIALSLHALLMGGCRAAPRRRSMRLEPLERRVDVVPGRTLVMPVSVDGPIDPRVPIRPLLDDGRALPAQLFWVAVASDESPSWLPPAGAWSATPAAAHVRPAGAGAWCLVLPMPADGIGQGIWLGSRRVPLNWLADAALIVPPGESSPWEPPLSDVPAQLRRLAEPEALSPVRRWRHRLLTRGLAPQPPPADDDGAGEPPVTPDRFDDPVLEALARQGEDRWRLALAGLWRADPSVADALKRRLVLTVEFPGGVVAPAWPCEQESLDRLLYDLLNPRLSDPDRAARTGVWLDEQPAAVGWVIDDAGAVEGITARSIATCAVANLSDRRTLAWAAAIPLRASPDMTPLEPRTAHAPQVSPPIAAPEDRQAAGPASAPIGLHVGRWSATVSAVTDPLPARPPGFRVGPFLTDWMLPRWLAGAAEPVAPEPAPDAADWSAAAVLMPTQAALAEAGAVSGPDATRWSLFLECRSGPSGTPGPAEVVRVWLGPFGRASRVLRVTSAGEVTTEGAGRSGVGGVGSSRPDVTVIRREDRWIALISIPDGCVEPSGVLRLGVERTDARGRHSAWPRPMLPWQFEPGRAAIDLSAWDGVTSAGPR